MQNEKHGEANIGRAGAGAFSATYSDWKVVRSRKVVQIVLEIPLEPKYSNHALKVLGGMPNPAAEVWVAIARLNTESEVMQHLPGSNADGRVQPPDNAQPASTPKQSARAKRSWDEMSPAQQAGVLCADKSFQKFMTFNTNYEPDEPTAAQLVRNYCGVPSRAIIATNDASSLKWDKLVSHYRAWMHEPSVVPA